MNPEGETALVTGGGARIGRVISLELARMECNVAVHYNQSRENARETVDELREMGVDACAVSGNFEHPDDLENVLDGARELGPVTILVNNASIFEHERFRETNEQLWDRTMDVNLKAPFLLCQLFDEQRPDREGRIVNMLDWRARRPRDDHFAYTVSQGGFAALTESLAVELAPDVNVNGVLPGPILPPEGKKEKELSHVIDSVPANRWGTPGEVANAVAFFIEGPDYITGELLTVDGGRHLV